MEMQYELVATTDELAPGDIKPIEVGGRALCLYRVGDDYFATQRRCLHQGADLAEGIVSGGHVVCAQHGWRFALDTGQHELSPETCLRTYPVRVQDGRVWVAARPNPLGDPA